MAFSVGGNLGAFLDLIAFSEGTSSIPNSDDGYLALVGGGTFTSFADHPRILVPIPRLGISSTAAGRYQLLERYYDAYRVSIPVQDFSPTSQDTIATQQIRECGALDDIVAGELTMAVLACAHIWASFPGSGYGQGQTSMTVMTAAYVAAGGTLAA